MSPGIYSIWIVLIVGLFSTAAALSAQEKPNLLLITVDDMNADSVGVFRSQLADTTPNIDHLAKEGIRFERAHVQVANCMPSRNVMWSGLYPHSNRVEGFYQVMNPGYLTLVDYAKLAGYFTAIQHKDHDSSPYTPYAWDVSLHALPVLGNQSIKDPKSYGLATAEAIRLAKQAGKPFYLLINIADPHVPFFGLNRKGEPIDDPFVPSRLYHPDEVPVPGFLPDDPVVREELAHYYSSVRRADDAVGEILQALKSSGEDNSTLVMFLSDHGMPFPFAKTQLYHWSTRTPLVIRWPGVIEAGFVDSEHMVSAVDLLPTLLDSIGVAVPANIQGRTFMPLLKGETQDDRDSVFKMYMENAAGGRSPMRAVESPQFLYIFNPWSNGERTMHSATNNTRTYRRMLQLAKRDQQLAGRLELLSHRQLEEFYDVRSDPDCLVNLVNDPAYSAEVERYRGMLESWMRRLQDPMLPVFSDRHDAAKLAAYMRDQQRQTDERKHWARAIKARLEM